MKIKSIKPDRTLSHLRIETEDGDKFVLQPDEMMFEREEYFYDLSIKLIPEKENLQYIEFFVKNRDIAEKIEDLIEKYSEWYNNHQSYFWNSVYRGVLKGREGVLKELEKIEKFFKNLERKRATIDELLSNFREFDIFNTKYWKTTMENKIVIFLKPEAYYKKEEQIFVVVLSEDFADIRKTKSYLTLNKMFTQNKICLGNLQKVNAEDIKLMKEKGLLMLLKALLFDESEKIRKKFENLLTIYSLV